MNKIFKLLTTFNLLKLLDMWSLLLEFLLDAARFAFSAHFLALLIIWNVYLDQAYYQRYNIAYCIALVIVFHKYTNFTDVINSIRSRFLNK